jgi:hypothetical protein
MRYIDKLKRDLLKHEKESLRLTQLDLGDSVDAFHVKKLIAVIRSMLHLNQECGNILNREKLDFYA